MIICRDQPLSPSGPAPARTTGWISAIVWSLTSGRTLHRVCPVIRVRWFICLSSLLAACRPIRFGCRFGGKRVVRRRPEHCARRTALLFQEDGFAVAGLARSAPSFSVIISFPLPSTRGARPHRPCDEIGRASCRERVCPYV